MLLHLIICLALASATRGRRLGDHGYQTVADAAAAASYRTPRIWAQAENLSCNSQHEGCVWSAFFSYGETSGNCCNPKQNWCDKADKKYDMPKSATICFDPLDYPKWLTAPSRHHRERLPRLQIDFAIAKMMEEGVLSSNDVKYMRSERGLNAAETGKMLSLEDFAQHLAAKGVPLPDKSDTTYYPTELPSELKSGGRTLGG